MKTKRFFTSLLLTTVGFHSYSQEPPHAHPPHTMSQDSSEGNMDMMGAMQRMMREMQQMKITGNTTVDFATHFKHHHQGAVDMTQVELRKGTDPLVKAEAQLIGEKQKKEIENLDRIIGKHKSQARNKDKQSSSSEVIRKGMMATMEMMRLKPQSSSVDHQFASMMIRHHQDGIKMSQMMLEKDKDPEFKGMLQRSIGNQKKDIKELTRLLGRLK